MANTNFTAEQQKAIDTYNRQQQVGTEKWVWNTQTQAAARKQLQNAWVWMNANWFFSINSTPTTTSGTTTKPTQQVSQNQNNTTIQPSVSNQNNSNNQNQTTVQQQWALKPLSQDYYNQTDTESQNTIVSNLNTYKQTNPEYFSDYDSFKRNFSYDARNDEQKQTLDTWYKGYQRGMELNSKAVSDLATQYKNWLVSDSDLEQLRTANSAKYAEVMQYVNKQTILSKYDEEANIAQQDNPFQEIINQYYQNLLTASQTDAPTSMFDEYKSQMSSPEMTELSDQLADKEWQIKEYQQELNRIKSDVEKRYEWTWASKSKINAIIADESYKIQELMNTANLEYNTMATKYNNRMQQYQNEFQLQLQEYEFQMSERNQQMQELWFVMDLMNFETNEQKDEREWNNYVRQYDFQYWNINSADYWSRKRAVENAVDSVLTEFSGITMIRSRDQMVEDIMWLVDGWMSLWEAITKNIREPIMQKPEYATRQASRYGWTQTWKNTFTVWEMSYTVWADGKVSYSWVAWKTTWWLTYNTVSEADKQNGMSSYINSIKTQITNHDKIRSWWCWTVVNDYLDSIWAWVHYDNNKSTKLNSKNSDTPTVWSIAIWENTWTEAWKKYGHVAIVKSVNNDWTITVLESNEWTWLRYAKYKQSNVYGYFDPSKWSGGSISTANWDISTTDAFTTAWNNIALHLWSVSATNSFNEQLQKYLNNGDYDSAFEYITTQAKAWADSDTKKSITAKETALWALVAIQEWLQAYYDAGWDTWILYGSLDDIANRLWKVKDPKLTALSKQIQSSIQQYRQAISWAAFSEQEAAEYAALFPSKKNSAWLNQAIIQWTLTAMLDWINNDYWNILWSNAYLNLQKAYEQNKWSIYDFYWNKTTLVKYLKNNWLTQNNTTQNNKQNTITFAGLWWTWSVWVWATVNWINVSSLFK